VNVGLDYLSLSRSAETLSGGEAQRLKLAGFLAGAAKTATSSKQSLAKKGTLFLFDEPTTGLHFDDIAKLMRALRKLLEGGHSLIVIEHNLDVIRASDWLIDLGPEGGDAGGYVVAEGMPEDVRNHATSHTALALREYALQGREKYKAIVFDEGNWQLIHNNKKLFQAGNEPITMAQSPTQQFTYSLWAYSVPMIVCSNNFWTDCTAEAEEYLNANIVYVPVNARVYVD
jgi:ABC-type multidrug transport system ATPase subunit